MRRRGRWLIGIAVCGVLLVALTFEILTTRSVRGAVHTFTQLLIAANRTDLPDEQRIELARGYCARGYLQRHGLSLASEGGIIGVPRMLHKNFKAWREGSNVWLCPSNRVGPVYQFVYEENAWRFDGLAGLLREWGEFIPAAEMPDAETFGR